MKRLQVIIAFAAGCLLAEWNHRWAFRQGEQKGYALRKSQEQLREIK